MTPRSRIEDAPEFDTLKDLANTYWALETLTQSAKGAMSNEAARLVIKGKQEGPYGQTSAVARVTRWAREHVDRIATRWVKKASTVEKPDGPPFSTEEEHAAAMTVIKALIRGCLKDPEDYQEIAEMISERRTDVGPT